VENRKSRDSFIIKKLPVIFTLYFDENFVFDTRNRDNLHLVWCKTSYGLRSVKYTGSNLRNQLPNELQVIASLNSFRSELKFILATSLI